MALYLISYDITDKDKFEYDPLLKRLKDLNAQRLLLSHWAIVADTHSASAIYDELHPFIMDADSLLVQEVTKDARSNNNLKISAAAFGNMLLKARS